MSNEPETEGGNFLLRALLNDVVHPDNGYDPQTDATDPDDRPAQRATDSSQGHGASESLAISPEDKAMAEFRSYIQGTLRPSRNRLRR